MIKINKILKEGFVLQKIKKIFLILTIIITCVSCSEINYELEINKDGSANLAYYLEFDKQLFDTYDEKYQSVIEKAQLTLEQNGFEVKKVEEQDSVKFETRIYINDIKKIDEFPTLIEPITYGQPTVLHSKNLLYETYEFNGKIDLTTYSENKNDLEKDEFIADNLEINFKVKVPTSNVRSNADEVDGEELKWKLKYNQENEVCIKYIIVNYAVIGIICLILFIGVQIFTIKIVKKIIQKRSKNEE